MLWSAKYLQRLEWVGERLTSEVVAIRWWRIQLKSNRSLIPSITPAQFHRMIHSTVLQSTHSLHLFKSAQNKLVPFYPPPAHIPRQLTCVIIWWTNQHERTDSTLLLSIKSVSSVQCSAVTKIPSLDTHTVQTTHNASDQELFPSESIYIIPSNPRLKSHQRIFSQRLIKY